MKLLERGNIGSLILKNRVIMAPMNVGGNNESDGCLSQRGLNYFVERAKGGVGMIVTGSVRVSRKFERDEKTIPLWMLFADHMIHVKWMSELAERCHDYGAAVAVQLTAGGGRQAGRYAQEHNLAIGPSANPCFYPPYYPTREMSKEEIREMVRAFGQAAYFCKQAGIDAIQLHGHEGYLMDQFTTSLWNKRTDEYGGSLANRLRFVREIIEEIRKNTGADYPIIYRYGLTHGIEGGRTIDEGLEMAKLLEQYGVDALDVDAGCYDSWYLPHPPSTMECGSFAQYSKQVKNVVSIPVVCSGRVGYPDVAEKILEHNEADYVSLGRPLIADPNWVCKVENGKAKEVRPCLACHEGCLKRLMQYKSLSCAVNPCAGNEDYLKLTKTDTPKNAIVIGGGVAGMVAAITLSKRGHKVVLIEKGDELGGNFRDGFVPEFKSDYSKYIQYLKEEVCKEGVEVIYNADGFSHPSLKLAQIVIVAVGAEFRSLPIEADNDAITPWVLYSEEVKQYAGKNIIIIGGGLVGVEAALNAAKHGAKVTILEKGNSVAKDMYKANRDHLLLLLKQNYVEIFTEASITNIKNGQINFIQAGKTQSISYDAYTICVGMLPRVDYKTIDSKYLIIGDALTPGRVIDAVWSAYRKCRLL